MLGLDHDKIILLSIPFPTIPVFVVVMLFCSMLGINDVVLYCIELKEVHGINDNDKQFILAYNYVGWIIGKVTIRKLGNVLHI